MWSLYQTAQGCRSRPSELVGVSDRWAAYQFDSAVIYLGQTLENAAQELVKIGDEMKPRYTLTQLLDPTFRLPRSNAGDLDSLTSAYGASYDEVG